MSAVTLPKVSESELLLLLELEFIARTKCPEELKAPLYRLDRLRQSEECF